MHPIVTDFTNKMNKNLNEKIIPISINKPYAIIGYPQS